ncbi:MAG: hypothetical protein VB144_12920 [Clostridia bacterium]|nr:hypothetical protein [Clostridia bacterium]
MDFGIIGFLLSYVVGMYLTAWIHEAGHVLFGWFAGKKFRAFYVWPLLSFVDKGEVKLRFSFRSKLGTFGWTYMDSVKPEFSYREEILYYSGGIIANVVSGLLFAIIGLSLQWYSDIRAGCLSFIPYSLISVGCFSFAPAIAAGYPYKGKSVMSCDGLAVQRLLNGKKHQMAEPIAVDKLAKHSSGRFELGDTERHEYIEQLLDSPDVYYKRVGYGNLIEFYLDRGDEVKVEEVQSKIEELSFCDDDFKKFIEAIIVNHGKTPLEYLTGKAKG